MNVYLKGLNQHDQTNPCIKPNIKMKTGMAKRKWQYNRLRHQTTTGSIQKIVAKTNTNSIKQQLSSF